MPFYNGGYKNYVNAYNNNFCSGGGGSSSRGYGYGNGIGFGFNPVVNYQNKWGGYNKGYGNNQGQYHGGGSYYASGTYKPWLDSKNQQHF